MKGQTHTQELGLHVNCGYADDKAPHDLLCVCVCLVSTYTLNPQMGC